MPIVEHPRDRLSRAWQNSLGLWSATVGAYLATFVAVRLLVRGRVTAADAGLTVPLAVLSLVVLLVEWRRWDRREVVRAVTIAAAIVAGVMIPILTEIVQ